MNHVFAYEPSEMECYSGSNLEEQDQEVSCKNKIYDTAFKLAVVSMVDRTPKTSAAKCVQTCTVCITVSTNTCTLYALIEIKTFYKKISKFINFPDTCLNIMNV